MRAIQPFIAASALLLSGCARVTTTTSVHADGSFSRKVVYTISKSGAGMGSPQEGSQKSKPEDFFKLPASGPGVKVVRSEDKNGLIVTVTRDVGVGAPPLQDIALWGEKGKVLATSTVSVRKLDDGRIEYVETLHAAQPVENPPQYAIADLRGRVKKALPAEFQKTETIDKVTHGVMVNVVHALLGPPEPNLFNLLLSPDQTMRRINAVAFSGNVATLRDSVPDLTDDQARSIARSLSDVLNQEALDQSSATSEASKPKESADNEMTPLFFAVGFPGRAVETNGIADPVTGEVYWSLLPATLAIGDVQLRLVVQP